MLRREFTESSGDFSLYGVARFTSYIMSATALYLENFQVAAIAFGFGALLGFLRRVARIWEQPMMYPTIIQFMYPDRILSPKCLAKLADLILFYWEFRFDNPDIQLAEA